MKITSRTAAEAMRFGDKSQVAYSATSLTWHSRTEGGFRWALICISNLDLLLGNHFWQNTKSHPVRRRQYVLPACFFVNIFYNSVYKYKFWIVNLLRHIAQPCLLRSRALAQVLHDVWPHGINTAFTLESMQTTQAIPPLVGSPSAS